MGQEVSKAGQPPCLSLEEPERRFLGVWEGGSRTVEQTNVKGGKCWSNVSECLGAGREKDPWGITGKQRLTEVR